MTSSEGLSKRDFLTAFALGVGGLAVSSHLAKILSPTPDLGESSPSLQDLERLIQVESEQNPTVLILKNRKEVTKIHASVNKPAWVQAIHFFANFKDPVNGLTRLHSFLRNHPLKISCPSQYQLVINIFNNKPYASYFPAYFGGPAINAYPPMLKEYYKAQKDPNLVSDSLSSEPQNAGLESHQIIPQLIAQDIRAWHEISHLFQEVMNPMETLFIEPIYEIGDILDKNGLETAINYANNPLEIEARQESSRIQEAYIAEFLGYGNKIENLPPVLGNFFHFVEI